MLFQRIADIFTNAHRNSATHSKGAQQLKAIMQSEDVEYNEFMTCMKKCVHSCLKQDYRLPNPFADRSVAFVASFCTVVHDHHQKNVDPDTDAPAVTSLVNFLIEMSNLESDNHRVRSCQFICKIFHDLIGYDVTVEFCNAVQDCLLTLMEDKLAKVRMLAAVALTPLQDMENSHCPIITAYINHMEYDPSASVRRVCAEKIGLKRENIPYLLETSRDIDIQVKLAVYKRASKYPNKFKIIHKQQLVHGAIKDPDRLLQTFMTEVLIPAWLQHYEFDYLKYMSGLRLDSTWTDLDTTASVCEYIVTTLFVIRPAEELVKVLTLNDKKLIEFENLNYDSALFWRLFIQHLRRTNGTAIEDYAPQLPELCQYIEEYCIYSQNKINLNEEYTNAHLEFKFILVQLFHLTMDYNYVDISCKKTMCALIERILKTYNLDLEVVKVMIENLTIVLPSINDQSKYICDITGDLMYSQDPDDGKNATELSSIANVTKVTEAPVEELQLPPPQVVHTMQEEQAINKLKLKCVMLEGEMEEAVRRQDYLKASELKPLVDAAKQEFKELLNIKPKEIPETLEESVVEEEETEHDSQTRREKVQDPILMKKVLTIMAGFLTSSKIRTLNSIVATFKVNVIDEMILSTNMSVKILAMRCLALCCTLDEHTAKIALPTCCAIIMTHNRNAQNPPPADLVWICIGIVVDSLMLFGTKLLANNNTAADTSHAESLLVSEEDHEVFSGGISLSGIIKEILEIFNDENVKLQELACRGICNFVLTSRIYSHAVISRLIVKFVLPTCSEPESIKLQQYIGITLGKLPYIPNSSTQLEKAIIPALKIILKAPHNSPLSNVDIDPLARLLFEICSQYENGLEIHHTLALAFIKEIRDKPNNVNNAVFSKVMLLLKFSNDKEELRDLVEKLDDLRDRLRDSKVSANIIKLNTKITLLLNSENNEESNIAESQELQVCHDKTNGNTIQELASTESDSD